METELEGAPAWLLPIDKRMNVAVGQFEFIHVVDQPEYIAIPQAPEYCKHVILWNENIVPVMNFSSWLSAEEKEEDFNVVAILIYKNLEGELAYGGIKLVNVPVLSKIDNTQGCFLPDDADKWKKISLSCFKSNNGDIVPILDIAILFLQKIEF